mmetsp:Transcript_101203/g.241304  ORF Transcript_101203/g.241304 Transcript_101203/m.241304 type:complete len:222 (-) Transcript_101203:91-756(-)
MKPGIRRGRSGVHGHAGAASPAIFRRGVCGGVSLDPPAAGDARDMAAIASVSTCISSAESRSSDAGLPLRARFPAFRGGVIGAEAVPARFSRISPSKRETSSFRIPSIVVALSRSACCAWMASRSKGSKTSLGDAASLRDSSVPMLRNSNCWAFRICAQYFSSPVWRVQRWSAADVITSVCCDRVSCTAGLPRIRGIGARLGRALLGSSSFSLDSMRGSRR